jgi:hypothetical protein
VKKLLSFFGIACVLMAAAPSFVQLVPITSLTRMPSGVMPDSTHLYMEYGGTYYNTTLDTLLTTIFNRPISLTNGGSLTADSLISAKTQTNVGFLDSVTGYTATVTDSVYCSRNWKNVTCYTLGATGTSNATAHLLQHLPAALRPKLAQLVTLTQITDTSVVFYGVKATVGTDGVVTLTNNGTAFKNTGTFALTAGTTFSYTLY